MTLTATLAEFAARGSARGFPDDARHHAKRALLDWFAAVIPATRDDSIVRIARAFAGELGDGACTVIGFGTTSSAATAAWINGTAAHALELDDAYREGVIHPGSPAITAALAAGELHDVSGKALLEAIVVGYEVGMRVSAAIAPSHVRRFHATGTVGCLGAAAAAAMIFTPRDAAAIGHALATAATFASGLQQALRSETMTKSLHAGHAASVGVRAAQMAACGITGGTDMLEGEFGLGPVMADRCVWERVTDGLGERFHTGRVTQKIHACCGHAFTSIDAALALRTSRSPAIDHIKAIEISTYQVALDATDRFEPRTPYEAKFSLPYVVCHALVHGAVRLDAFSAERLGDRAVRALMPRCRLAVDPAMSAAFPGRRPARVTIELASGERVSHFAEYRRGDPEIPLTDADLDDKFADLAVPVIGATAARALAERVWLLERHAVRELTPRIKA